MSRFYMILCLSQGICLAIGFMTLSMLPLPHHVARMPVFLGTWSLLAGVTGLLLMRYQQTGQQVTLARSRAALASNDQTPNSVTSSMPSEFENAPDCSESPRSRNPLQTSLSLFLTEEDEHDEREGLFNDEVEKPVLRLRLCTESTIQ